MQIIPQYDTTKNSTPIISIKFQNLLKDKYKEEEKEKGVTAVV